MVWLSSLLEIVAKWTGYLTWKKRKDIEDRENPEKELARRKERISQEIIQGDEVLANSGLVDDFGELRKHELQGDRERQGSEKGEKR